MSALAVGERARRYSSADRWRPQQAEAVCDDCGQLRPIVHTGTRHTAVDGARASQQVRICGSCWDDLRLDGRGEL